MADVDGEQRASTMKQQKLPGVDSKSVSKIQADNSVSDFVDATATPHSTVDSYYFRRMIEDIQTAGLG